MELASLSRNDKSSNNLSSHRENSLYVTNPDLYINKQYLESNSSITNNSNVNSSNVNNNTENPSSYSSNVNNNTTPNNIIPFNNTENSSSYNSNVNSNNNTTPNNIIPFNNTEHSSSYSREKELNCQTDFLWKPDVIVLGPGGMKGFLHLGCLIPFDSLGILNNIKIMVGVSVGSIILLLYLIGYRIEDIIQEGLDIDIEKDFIDFDLENLKSKGLFKINKLANKLNHIIVRKFGYIPNLRQLYNFTNIRFMIITTKLPGSEIRIDYTSDPDLSCVNAVLFSSTIPFVFTPMIYKNMKLYDGALTNPYPTNIFDDGILKTLAFYITADEHVEEGFFWLLNTLVRIPMKQLRIVNQVNASNNVKHIELTSPTMDFTGVSSDVDEKNGMIKSGFLKAIELLNTLGYDTSSLNVNDYLEIPYTQQPVPENGVNKNSNNSNNSNQSVNQNKGQNGSQNRGQNKEPELDPNRYITITVDPYLYDHQSSDQLGYYEVLPKIDFSIIDPEIDDTSSNEEIHNDIENDINSKNNLTDNQQKSNGNNIKNIDTEVSNLLSVLQTYLDKK